MRELPPVRRPIALLPMPHPIFAIACAIALALLTLSAPVRAETPPPPAPPAPEIVARARALAPRLEKMLHENVAAFWAEHSIDTAYGGYHMHFNLAGERLPGSKMIVTQARSVWFFARLARFGHERKANLERAAHGLGFLRNRMWDSDHGGFFWEVDATGTEVIQPIKHLYGQAFALYALSEYALAAEDSETLGFATALFQALEERAHDGQFGGYLEYFERDWSIPAPDRVSPMGTTADVKLMNTHLHLMEAMTTFVQASGLHAARERLLELLRIQTNAVVRKDLGLCTDRYDRAWTPLLAPPYNVVSYGHDIENVWLIMDACDGAAIADGPFHDLYRTLFATSLRLGYDHEAGGFYDVGPLDGPADRLNKIWWVQTEALVSALRMWRLTGEAMYFDVFEQTFHWVDRHMVDWDNGEWFEVITPEGERRGAKGHNWKSGYHNGRALIECLTILRALDREEQ